MRLVDDEAWNLDSGDGSGYGRGAGWGCGDGLGDGDGNGFGYGTGEGSGDGFGDGEGSGLGWGEGSSDGEGDGTGWGDGSGAGYDDTSSRDHRSRAVRRFPPSKKVLDERRPPAPWILLTEDPEPSPAPPEGGEEVERLRASIEKAGVRDDKHERAEE